MKLKPTHITFSVFNQKDPIDIKEAINGFDGDEATFYNWLSNFMNSSISDNNMQELIEPYETQNFKKFSQLIQKLKIASKQIGAG